MSGIDIFAWVVLITIVVSVIYVVVVLAAMPGKIAKKRNHPYAESINVLGWLGLLFFGVIWVLALGWALADPRKRVSDEYKELKQRISKLEQAISTHQGADQ